MRVELTEMSKKNVNFLMGCDKTPRQIVMFLKEQAMIRSFSETLHRIYPGNDLAIRITDVLAEASGDSRANVLRKVQNWIKDEHVPKNREILFQICFAIQAKEEGAGRILGMCAENGIHYRNPKELVYAYGLKKGMSYPQAQELWKKIENRLEETQMHSQVSAESYTKMISLEFQEIWTEEELMEFFQRNQLVFGTLHNTAYQIYGDLLAKLSNPETIGMDEEEEKYKVDKVLDCYLRMNVPNSKRTGRFPLLQRVVKKYWPNQRSIIQMKNRREDIGRKALILLQLITEEFEQDSAEEFLQDLGRSAQEEADLRLETRFIKMNMLLDLCGMSKLDPCCPFDYLVLYAMKTQEDEYMGERMTEVVETLFLEKSFAE